MNDPYNGKISVLSGNSVRTHKKIQRSECQGMSSAQIQQKWPELFGKFNANTFRSRFNSLAKYLGFSNKARIDGELFVLLNFLLCLTSLGCETKKLRIESRCTINNKNQKVIEKEDTGSIETSSDNDESNNLDLGSELILSDSMFKPIYNLGVWLSPDDDENAHLSVPVLLFTGTDKKIRST